MKDVLELIKDKFELQATYIAGLKDRQVLVIINSVHIRPLITALRDTGDILAKSLVDIFASDYISIKIAFR